MSISSMKNGFTLLELSIVLVIIGLIVGGITAGSSMIRAAELRSQATQFQSFTTAFYTFKDKYMQIPGDISNAAQFWPSTTSGDGDGTLEWRASPDGSIGARYYGYETALFWQHLSLAGLTEGNYDATTTSPIGLGYPGMKANPGDGLIVSNSDSASQMTNQVVAAFNKKVVLYSVAGARLQYGIDRGVERGILGPDEMWVLDKKMDDGLPQTGALRARSSYGYTGSNLCLANDSSTADVYDVDGGTEDSCGIMFTVE